MLIILPSAATMSPASRSNMSPRTTFEAGISCFIPSRMTLAWGADRFLSAANDFSALTYWIVPSTAFIIRTANITIVLSTFPENMDTTAAATRITTKRSANCPRNMLNILFFFFSLNRFSPYFSSSSCALLVVNPPGSPYSLNNSPFVC